MIIRSRNDSVEVKLYVNNLYYYYYYLLDNTQMNKETWGRCGICKYIIIIIIGYINLNKYIL